jgi:hypothetical protein
MGIWFILYIHLVYFWHFRVFWGHLVYFPIFGILYHEKYGNPVVVYLSSAEVGSFIFAGKVNAKEMETKAETVSFIIPFKNKN